MSLHCTLCGTANASTNRFCQSCGVALGSPRPATPPLSAAAHPSLFSPPVGQGWPAPAALRTAQGGRYVFEESIGQGGMSAVFRARDTHFSNRVVAIKEMVDQFADAVERAEAEANFRQEADLLAALRHPAIPQVIDRFSENSRHYLVMEFIDGRSLEDMLEARKGQPLPEKQVRGWAVEICSVLAYLHDRTPPIIFRDLKPSNIMIEREGAVRLIDFGIARLFKPQKKADTTALGTTGYASPEHYTGQTDARSDIYSLGAMLHYLLSGRDPSKHPPFQFPPLRELNPAISADLEAVVQRCLDANALARFTSTGALRAALLDSTAMTTPPVAVVAPAGVGPKRGKKRGAPSGKLLVLADVRSGADRAAIVKHVANLSGDAERATGALLKHLPAVVPITRPAAVSTEVQQLAQLGAVVRAVEPATDIVDIPDDLREELRHSHQLVIWDATVGDSRACHCHRCNHMWRTKKQVGEKVPRFCPNCGSQEWSKRRLFKCAWCSHEFETSNLTGSPESLYATCPGCGLPNWQHGTRQGSRPLKVVVGGSRLPAPRSKQVLTTLARVGMPVAAIAMVLSHLQDPILIPFAFVLSWAFFGRPPKRSRRR